ncbi:MAG: hypothetical protein GF331_07230 [Chitinivibrionales bacterium]|nr:hypothetical protein [Chitinivibrionales bacterium]
MIHSRISVPQSLAMLLLLVLAAGCDRFDNSTSLGADVANDIDPERADPNAVFSTVQSFAVVEEVSSARIDSTDSTMAVVPVGRWRGERSYAYIDFDTLYELTDTFDSCRVWLRLTPQALSHTAGDTGSDSTVDHELFALSVGTIGEKTKRVPVDPSTITAAAMLELERNDDGYLSDSLLIDENWGDLPLLDTIYTDTTWMTVRKDSLTGDTTACDTTAGGSADCDTTVVDTITYDTTHVVDLRGLFVVLGPAAEQDSVVRFAQPTLALECYHTVTDTTDTGTVTTTDTLKKTIKPKYWDHTVLEDNPGERDGQPFTSRAPSRYAKIRISLEHLLNQALDSADGHGFRTIATANITVPLAVSTWESPKRVTVDNGGTTTADSTWQGGAGSVLRPHFALTRAATKPEVMYSDGIRIGRRLDENGSDSIGFAQFYVRPIMDSVWNSAEPGLDEELYLYIEAPFIGELYTFRQAIWGVAPGDSIPVEFVLTNPQ